MGLIDAAKNAVQNVFADTWREYFYCDSMDDDILMVKGQKKVSGKSSNTKGSDNVISNGSVIAVNEGQCMLIVDQGAIVEVCAQPGEFIYDSSSEPSIFYGSLGESLKNSFKSLGRRISFGGDVAKDQRVYFVNIKQISGNKYGTAQPIPFRLYYPNLNIDRPVQLRCNGEYVFKITDPILFYKEEAGNVVSEYEKTDLVQNTLRPEFLNALRSVLGDYAQKGIRYDELTFHSAEICTALQDKLSQSWTEKRGLTLVSIELAPSIPDKDLESIQKFSDMQYYNNMQNAAGALVESQAEAMKSAAKNEGGAMIGFMGMNMAQQKGGIDAQNLFAMSQMQQQQMQQAQMAQAPVAQAPAADSWTCTCGAVCTGKFCTECGAAKPADGWTCTCGAVNKGKFCPECGAKKPAGAPLYRCDKCGWEPEDPKNPPKFCPECGDKFTDEDIQ